MPNSSATNPSPTPLFQRNLQFLRQSQPELASTLATLTPTTLVPAPDLSNDFRFQGEAFYGMDGKQAAQQQVQQYWRAPTHFSLKYRSIPGNRYLHQDAINQLNDHATSLGYVGQGKPKISNLIALGSGLGFHITELRKQMQFANIVIVEPESEMLWHLLQHLNLSELSEHCYQSGGHLSILQPTTYQTFATAMHTLAKRSGFGLFAEVSVFRHYETPLFDTILENFQTLRNNWVSAWGFINDEYIGLRNTLQNAHLTFIDCRPTPQSSRVSNDEKEEREEEPETKTERKTETKENAKTQPVVIVGNGPSLDQDLPLLIKTRQQFTIISCGTALGTLLKNDIVPDFHAEMERSNFTAMVQQKWFNDSLCQQVTLLALNTVSPAITHKFDRVWLFPKGNDIGAQMLTRANDEQGHHRPLPPLKYCNPTVTNFALTAACALNMTNVVLLGCDYGFRNQQQHHAAQSDYYNHQSRLSGIAPKPEMQVPDNHGGLLNSSRVLTLSRENIETLLRHNPHMQVTNCSDGAQIQHTQWLPFSDIVKNGAKQNLQTVSIPDHKRFHLHLDDTRTTNTLDHYIDVANTLQKHINSLSNTQSLNLMRMQTLLQKIDSELQTSAPEARADIYFGGSARYLSVCIAGHLSRLPKKQHAEYCQHAHANLQHMFREAANYLLTLKQQILSQKLTKS